MDFLYAFRVSKTIDSMNIAIPVSLVGENKMGQLMFTLFVQASDGYLSKEHLSLAIQASKDVLVHMLRLYRLIRVVNQWTVTPHLLNLASQTFTRSGSRD